MCLLAFARNVSHDFPFVLVHNRDEDFRRATSDPVHPPQDDIYCGTDCVHGGTWLGFNRRTGMLAAMTNVRHVDFPVVPIAESTSRGMLVQQWLNGSIPFPVPGSSTVLPGKFNGFNILLTNLFKLESNLVLVSNAPQPSFRDIDTNTFCNETCRVFDVASGVYGMSNSHFNDHTWPKVKKVSSCMRMIMDNTPAQHWDSIRDETTAVNQLSRQLLRMMTDSSDFDPAALPDVSFSTDPPHVERHNQKIFQPADATSNLFQVDFGTRAQTLVIRTQRFVHFLYRNTDKWPRASPLFHVVIAIPPTTEELQRLSLKRAALATCVALFCVLIPRWVK